MAQTSRWRPMSMAPRDGTRILVTVRPTEQGPADVDMAYWARADQFGAEGWRASDSNPGCIIAYAEPELKCWMPLPQSNPAGRPDVMPDPHEGDDIMEDGAGI